MAELNLIPNELRKRRGKGINTRSKFAAGVVSVIVIGGAVAYPFINYRLLQAEEKGLSNEVENNQEVLKESDRITLTITDYNQYLTMVEKITRTSPKIKDRVRGIERYMVGDIRFTNLSLASDVITIGATSGGVSSIYEFTANLQESLDYRDARVSGITFNKDRSNYTFTIAINY